MSNSNTEEMALVSREPQEIEVAERTPQTVRHTWNFSMDQMRHDMEHYTEEERETLIGLFRWCIDPRHAVKRQEAAGRIGCSPNLLYQLYTGCYKDPRDQKQRGPSADLLKRIRDFLEVEQRRYAAVDEDFVLTPTARKIALACELAVESRTPVILWGPSHIGKTIGLRHFQHHSNHGRPILVELEAGAGYHGMLRSLAKACGISDKKGAEVLVDKIKAALTPKSLLIIDEMHLLAHTYRANSFHKSVEQIRRIWDFCQCGMVLCWTHLEHLDAEKNDSLVQLWRRGSHKVALPVMPTKGDLAAVLGHHGLRFPERGQTVRVGRVVESPYEVLRQLAKQQGLKAVTERLRYAEKLAGKNKAKVRMEDFIDAHLRIEKQWVQEGEWD